MFRVPQMKTVVALHGRTTKMPRLSPQVPGRCSRALEQVVSGSAVWLFELVFSLLFDISPIGRLRLRRIVAFPEPYEQWTTCDGPKGRLVSSSRL